MQEDPILGNTADPMSFNRYQYCGADPADYSDPSGLTTISPKRGRCPDVDRWFNLLSNEAMIGAGLFGSVAPPVGEVLGGIGGPWWADHYKETHYEKMCAEEERRRANGTWPDKILMTPWD